MGKQSRAGSGAGKKRSLLVESGSILPHPNTHSQFEGRNRISADAMKHPSFLSLGIGSTNFLTVSGAGED